MQRRLMAALAATSLAIGSLPASANEEAAKRWIDKEFQPSVLTKEQQMEEMRWFIKAAAPFKGMELNIVAEGIPTHEYEARTLTKAFEEITGIRVNMQIMGEGDVVQALQAFRGRPQELGLPSAPKQPIVRFAWSG
jgi:glycerol transport system substrate-binding protein